MTRRFGRGAPAAGAARAADAGPRTYLVTGAASGMGAALAARLVADGHNVVACDIANELIDSERWPAARTAALHLDVRDPVGWADAVAGAVDRFGGLDVCCNIAGYLNVAPIGELTDADVDRHLDINVKGVVYGTRAAARQMLKQGHGHIVNMASLAALAPPPGLALYSASKFAVRGFSLSTAIELRGSGIAISVVYPDAVATPMLDVQLDRPEAALTFSGKRALSAEEVVEALVADVFVNRPLELGIPRSREALARFAGVWPRVTLAIEPMLRRTGLRNQAKLRAQRATADLPGYVRGVPHPARAGG